MKVLTSAFVLLGLSVNANAQECSALLTKGIYDIRETDSSVDASSSFSQWFCDQRFSSKDSADSFGASLGFPFKGLPVKLGFDSDKADFSQWYSNYCSNTTQDQTLRTRLTEYIETVNPVIVKAFTECISSVGLHAWIERTADPHKFKFATRFVSPGRRNPSAKYDSFTTGDNVKCDVKPIGRPIDASTWRTSCTRKNNKPVVLVANADWNINGGGELELPSILSSQEAPPIELPKKANALFLGVQKNCNAGIVSGQYGHLGCASQLIGYTVKDGPAAGTLLYLGATPNRNSGYLSNASNFRGGATIEWGYSLREASSIPGARQLFVTANCQAAGEVTVVPGHKNCATVPIGWVLP